MSLEHSPSHDEVAADRWRIAITTGVAFAALATAFSLVAIRERGRAIADLRRKVENETAPLAHSLSSAIERRFALVHGLKAFVESDFERADDVPRLDAFAARIRASAPGIRAMQIVRDGVIRYTYPIVGNEAAMGHDLAHDQRPRVRSEFLRAAAASTMTLSGPFELVQGGLGLVARHPVDREGGQWGLVAIVLDVPQIFSDAGFDRAAAQLAIAVTDATGRVFRGDRAQLGDAPIEVTVDLPDGQWVLAAAPRGGPDPWAAGTRRTQLRWAAAGATITGLVTVLLWTGLNRRAQRRRFQTELARRESETWRKAIRVIGHEINNSLAPISSLLHSARLIAQVPHKAPLLNRAFDTIEERTTHLRTFLDAYARLARLPEPTKVTVVWGEYLQRLQQLYAFRTIGHVPSARGYFDPAQIEQVLINLLKNAHESGSPPEEVEVGVAVRERGTQLCVRDRGAGMTPEQVERATDPFFTTKRSGSGLGLYLCKEIVLAHGGELTFANRAGGGTTVSFTLPA